jgi:hypothetical protein
MGQCGELLWDSGENPKCFPLCPSSFISICRRRGAIMIVKHLPMSEVDRELLGSVSGCMGLTAEEILTLMLYGGLTVVDILDYLEAVDGNRIH